MGQALARVRLRLRRNRGLADSNAFRQRGIGSARGTGGVFSPPRLATLEEAAAYGVGLRRGRVFADLWDLEKFSGCPACFAARKERLERMNFTQEVGTPVECSRCNDGGSAKAALFP